MKKSYVVVMSMDEQGAELMYEEPTAEFIRKHLGGDGVTFEMIRVQPGIELYCDEDARMKELAPRCRVAWRKWPNLPPVPQIIRGPAVFVMRQVPSSAKALRKMSMAVEFEFPIKVDQEDGAADLPVH